MNPTLLKLYPRIRPLLSTSIQNYIDVAISNSVHRRYRPTIKIRPGLIVYKVYGLGAASFMEKLTITSRPFCPEAIRTKGRKFYSGPFVETLADREWCPGGYKSDHSLLDMNVYQNSYNRHKTFLTYEEAAHYLRLCLSKGIALM